MPDVQSSDAMILRLEKELEEKNAFLEGLVGGAQDQNRDLTDSEKELTVQARSRVAQLDDQLKVIYDSREITARARTRAAEVHAAMDKVRSQVDNGPVEYRSAGAYLMDYWQAATGSLDARDRVELFMRAAAHQKTSDNLGIIPDPVIGNVLNFVDAARPLVAALGPQPMPSATWYRPIVTQNTTVGVQGSAGAAADEKSELVSQKMTIGRLTGNAVTYGGYVNVSRQNIDFSTPNALDVIVNDLAAQYAIQTEAALGAALIAGTNNVELGTASGGTPTADELIAGLWTAVGNVYSATKGIGTPILAVPTAKLGTWARLFGVANATSLPPVSGFSAGNFGQGVMGNISGIPVVVSAGLSTIPATSYGILLSSAAVEVYEQRVGQLQAIEPSVLGVQVAYAGYFTPMTVLAGGVQEIVNLA